MFQRWNLSDTNRPAGSVKPLPIGEKSIGCRGTFAENALIWHWRARKNKRLMRLRHCFQTQAMSVFYFAWVMADIKMTQKHKKDLQSHNIFQTERGRKMFPGNMSSLFFPEHSSIQQDYHMSWLHFWHLQHSVQIVALKIPVLRSDFMFLQENQPIYQLD